MHCSVRGKSQPQVLVETREEHCSNTAGLANFMGMMVLRKTAKYDWYYHFKTGEELPEEVPCLGRPSNSVNVETISKVKMVCADPLDNHQCK